ncbi:hypothetical protein FNH05_05205 [Amycolatopsis rhizosphaerae]|uniref:SaeA first Fn3-like domain-containing protein n=1 Tax=Amycolatopsis rhizosphaerae TaxID=2053003 RepID=A0A558DEK7_9PSEU|nr:hypothetical protein [Amycolatopsis rhizosphaerae]TVT59471.1 hypothetical protein FNH05_05205 [Amycolatopsis rhizosphaerae]
MLPFDAKAYEETVVKPLRRWSGRELPDDLVSRYAIDLAMSDAEVARRLTEVRSKWNKGITRPGYAQRIYKAFLRADEGLRRQHGAGLGTAAWWREYAKRRAGARQGQIDELAKTLRAHFGELGLITPGQLEATVRAAYAVLSPNEVDEALATAGITRSAPRDLPKASGLIDATYRILAEQLVEAEAASVVELLHGEIGGFRILDGFSARPPAPLGLTGEAVRAAALREDRRSGNQPARQALGILATAARDGVDLEKLALYHLLDEVRRDHAQGVPASALLGRLVRAKLDRDEACQAVFGVLNETGRAARVTGLDQIRELLEQGRLVAAQQALAAVTGTEDAAAATALVERQLAKVRELREGAQRALREGAEADALHRLRQAVALAGDDEELAAQIRRIPPEPVLGVAAAAEATGVRVSWRAAPTHGEDTRYRVVRREGRIPADPDDGTVVVASRSSEDGNGDGTVTLDRTPPAAVPLGYAVFAASGGGVWSRPAGVTAESLPEVRDVRLTVENGAVEGRWSVHPDAVGVRVQRGDGPVIAESARTVFRDQGVTDGAEVVYTLTARYRRPDGGEALSLPVVEKTSTRARPRPVRALTLAPVPGGTGPRVEISWQQQADTEVVVRRSPLPCPWEFGELVPSSALTGYGEEVTGGRSERDGWQVLTAAVPTGLFHYVTFTLVSGGALRGHDAALAVALDVRGLRYQRFGDELALSWEWPEDTGIADVRWKAAGESGRQRLTRQQYRSGGGCRVHCGPGEVEVVVRTVQPGAGGESTSAGVRLVVPGSAPALRYQVSMTRKPLVGGGTVRVRLSTDQPLPRCPVLVVAAPGRVMPRGPGDGQVLLRAEPAVRPGEDVELVAELPRLKRPFWVRCFPGDDSIRLTDPPVTQLKVP